MVLRKLSFTVEAYENNWRRTSFVMDRFDELAEEVIDKN
jgi:hypothetical protein